MGNDANFHLRGVVGGKMKETGLEMWGTVLEIREEMAMSVAGMRESRRSQHEGILKLETTELGLRGTHVLAY